MKEKKLQYLFLRKKPAEMLVQMLKNDRMKYASVIAKEVDCTYSHTVRILQELEKKGVVEFQKKGRLKIITLTKFGLEVAGTLDHLMKIFDRAG